MHAQCDCEACEDWSNQWRPVSPTFPEDPGSLSSLDLPLPPGATKKRKESPLELYTVAHPGLPVYKLKIGPPNVAFTTDAPTYVSVRTIMDMGAESNYRTAHKTRVAGAQTFPIVAREIVGAGQTTTSAFASFTLKVGRMTTECYTYILEDASQFCYDMLLGCTWLKRHDAMPRWEDDAYALTHPEKKVQFHIKPISVKEKANIPKVLTKLAWHLCPKHLGPPHFDLFHWAQEVLDVRDNESICTNSDNSTKSEAFGE
jgi:hypothetical protein